MHLQNEKLDFSEISKLLFCERHSQDNENSSYKLVKKKKSWQVTFITQKHNLKWATNLNISIIREDTQMANKHMKSL